MVDSLETLGFITVFILYIASVVSVVYAVVYYLRNGVPRIFEFMRLVQLVTILVPVSILYSDIGRVNDCCNNTAFFSAAHRLSVLALISLSVLAYFYSSWRKTMASPVVEILVNCLLILGIVLSFFIGWQENDWSGGLFFILPSNLLVILALIKNHKMALENLSQAPVTGLLKLCRKIVLLPAWQKFPVLLLLCLPVLLVLIGVLLLFGQQPDSFVRAFTDTYKEGFSQLNAQCDNVICPEGHYLCTVAAKGHSDFVKPLRSGIRGGKPIICNRQLLVANAFEELLEQKLPGLHRPIRAQYDKVGDFIYRYYGVFNNKWVADLVYVLMKPLEWLFVVVLYVADRKPENRIAQQYMDRNDRKKLRRYAN